MSLDERETVVETDLDIHVRKSFLDDAVRESTIRFEITSESDAPLTVRLFEAVPTQEAGVSPAASDSGGSEWRLAGPRLMEYRVDVDPHETVTADYRVEYSREDATRLFSQPTRLLVEPVDAETGPQLMTVGAGTHLGEQVEGANVDESPGDERPGIGRDGGWPEHTWPNVFDRPGESGHVERESESAETTAAGPAVGIVVTPGHTDAIVRSVLEASMHGFHVYLASAGTTDSEATRLAEGLGATVVSVEGASEETVRSGLEMVSRARGHSGLILQTTPYESIDFGQSVATLADRNSNVVDAIPETESRGETTVIAGIPAYNEAGTISDVVSEALEYVDEVLVVDDGSTDDTAQLAEQAGATVIRHGRNRGYGGALKTIFEQASQRGAGHLAVIDADGQHAPSDIPKMVESQRSADADIVIGSRFVPGAETDMPVYRRFGIGVVNLLMNVSLGSLRSESYIKDTQSGFRVYNREAIESLAADPDIGEGMNASTDIIFHAHNHGYAFEEVGTRVDYDVTNANSQNPVTHGLELVKNIFVTMEQRRPIALLGIPGFASLLLGLVLAYVTFQNYVGTGNFPLGISLGSVLFTLVGVFAYFTAIILHAVNHSPSGQ